MCFSNLPIEFDEEGNPYLAEEADDVEHVADCGCGADVAIDETDPETVYEDIVSSIPESVREEIVGGVGDGPNDRTPRDVPVDEPRGDAAEGD
jgi:hypothetical protein